MKLVGAEHFVSCRKFAVRQTVSTGTKEEAGEPTCCHWNTASLGWSSKSFILKAVSDFLLTYDVFVSAAASVQRQCSTLSNDRKFLLDMLYSRTSATVPPSPVLAAVPDVSAEGSFLPGEPRCSTPTSDRKTIFRFRSGKPVTSVADITVKLKSTLSTL